MLIYIFRTVDECLLISSMPWQRFKLQISLNYSKNLTKYGFLKCVNVKNSFDVVMVNTA